MRVLVIDDAAVARTAFVRMAERAGHVVVECDGADDVCDAAARADVDTVVIDGRLAPDGPLAAIARLRRARPNARIVVLAALGETALVRAAIDAGASAALLRPLVPSRVAAALESDRSEVPESAP